MDQNIQNIYVDPGVDEEVTSDLPDNTQIYSYVDENGNTIYYYYDQDGNIVYFSYDENGNVVDIEE